MSRGASFASLAEQVAEHDEWVREKRGPLWVVHFSEPAAAIHAPAGKEGASLVACLWKMRLRYTCRDTTKAGEVAYVIDPPTERVVAPEPFMPGVMCCVRMTGLHGHYYKCPPVERAYVIGEKQAETRRFEF